MWCEQEVVALLTLKSFWSTAVHASHLQNTWTEE